MKQKKKKKKKSFPKMKKIKIIFLIRKKKQKLTQEDIVLKIKLEINYCENNEIYINGVQQLIKVLGLLKKPYNDYEIEKYENEVEICVKKMIKLYNVSQKEKLELKNLNL